jgi:recombination protein RecA
MLARAHVESLLRARKLDVTLATTNESAGAVRAGSTGLAWLDAQMAGGWPYGETSEIVGPVSSGRTAVLGASLAAATQRGELAALVDPGDHFDPVTAASLGVDLDRVLWARGDAADPAGPRALERAIKAFGLVLDGGGFGLVALDVSEMAPATLARLPFTTWRRLQRLVGGRDTVALLLAAAPLSRSARGLTLQLTASAATTPVWRGDSARARRLVALRLAPRICATRVRVMRYE